MWRFYVPKTDFGTPLEQKVTNPHTYNPMEIKGYIKQVMDARGGVSSRDGRAWKLQQFLLETIEQYPRRMVFEVFGEDKLQQMDIHQGEEMTVSFDVDAHEYQGRWYNQIRAWKVEKTGRYITENGTQTAAQQYQTQVATAERPPFEEGREDKSGLPF